MPITKPVLKIRFIALISTIVLGTAIIAVFLLHPFDEKELDTAYAMLDSAMRRHDLSGYMSLLAPDYSEQRTIGGKLKPRNESEANYRDIMRDWTFVHDQKSDIYRLAVRNGEANVIVERSMSAILVDHRGLFGAKGESHPVSIKTMEVDAWTRTSHRWLMKTRYVTSIQMTMDGRKIHAGVVDGHNHD